MVGDGCSLPVWTTPWLVDGEKMCNPLMKNINLKVSDLLLPNSHLSDLQKLESFFYRQGIDIILQIKPVVSSQ